MTVNSYDLGDQVRVSVVFTDANDVATDPTTVTLRVKNHAGVVTVYSASVVKDSVGHYHQDVDVPVGSGAGGRKWWYRWEATGTLVTAEEGSFLVRRSPIVT